MNIKPDNGSVDDRKISTEQLSKAQTREGDEISCSLVWHGTRPWCMRLCVVILRDKCDMYVSKSSPGRRSIGAGRIVDEKYKASSPVHDADIDSFSYIIPTLVT